MNRIAKRINDVIKFNDENKNRMLDFLDEHSIVFRSIQEAMELGDEFVFGEHLLNASSYELYSYIKLKVISIFYKYFKGISINDEDDLYYKITSNYKESDSEDRLIYLASKMSVSVDISYFIINTSNKLS